MQVEVPQPQEEDEEEEKSPALTAAGLACNPITALLCAALYRLMQMLFLFLFLLLCFCLDSLPAAFEDRLPTTQPATAHPPTNAH